MAIMAELLAEVAAAGATVLFSSHQLDLVEDLCEDVVIIDHGRVVLAGELDDLRAVGPAAIRRHPLPRRATRLVGAAVGRARASRRTGEARLRIDRTPTSPRWSPSPDACPTSSRSPISHRRCRSCSAGGGGMSGLRQSWLVAVGRSASGAGPRASVGGLAIMLLVVVAAIVVPALLETGPVATRRRLHGRDPDRAAACASEPGRHGRRDGARPPLRRRRQRRGGSPRRGHRRARRRRSTAGVAERGR